MLAIGTSTVFAGNTAVVTVTVDPTREITVTGAASGTVTRASGWTALTTANTVDIDVRTDYGSDVINAKITADESATKIGLKAVATVGTPTGCDTDFAPLASSQRTLSGSDQTLVTRISGLAATQCDVAGTTVAFEASAAKDLPLDAYTAGQPPTHSTYDITVTYTIASGL